MYRLFVKMTHSKLIKMLEKCLFSCITGDAYKSKYVQREKPWAAFHQIRIQEAPKLWEDLFGYGFPKLSPINFQQVNQKFILILSTAILVARLKMILVQYK